MKIEQLLASSDASANQLSVELQPGDNPGFAIQTDFTGTPSGTLTMEASVTGVVYSTVSGSSTTVTAGVPASVIYDVPRKGYRFSRVRWTNSSGTGTITINADITEVPIPRG
jgi:hypothetical protein